MAVTLTSRGAAAGGGVGIEERASRLGRGGVGRERWASWVRERVKASLAFWRRELAPAMLW